MYTSFTFPFPHLYCSNPFSGRQLISPIFLSPHHPSFPLQPKGQFYNSPEVMFRAAYGGFPGQSPLASNMAAFTSAQALSAALQEESPQYKE